MRKAPQIISATVRIRLPDFKRHLLAAGIVRDVLGGHVNGVLSRREKTRHNNFPSICFCRGVPMERTGMAP